MYLFQCNLKSKCYSLYIVYCFIVLKKKSEIPKSPSLPATHIKNIFVLQFKWTSKENIQPFGTEIFMSYSENNETKYLQMSQRNKSQGNTRITRVDSILNFVLFPPFTHQMIIDNLILLHYEQDVTRSPFYAKNSLKAFDMVNSTLLGILGLKLYLKHLIR